jgi:hypothetical protein
MTSTSSSFNGRVALASAVAVTAGAFIGSASSLLTIGTHAQMAAPWALPVSLDLAAVGAAAAIRCRRADRLAWFTLICATAISTVMQIVDAPGDLLSRVAHGAPPVAALLCFELALRAMRPGGDPLVTGDLVETAPAPAVDDDHRQADSEPTPAPVRATTSRRRAPSAGRAKATQRAVPFEALVPVAETVAADLTARGRAVSRRALQDGMKAAGRPVGTDRATRLLDHLRSTPPAPTPTPALDAGRVLVEAPS